MWRTERSWIMTMTTYPYQHSPNEDPQYLKLPVKEINVCKNIYYYGTCVYQYVVRTNRMVAESCWIHLDINIWSVSVLPILQYIFYIMLQWWSNNNFPRFHKDLMTSSELEVEFYCIKIYLVHEDPCGHFQNACSALSSKQNGCVTWVPSCNRICNHIMSNIIFKNYNNTFVACWVITRIHLKACVSTGRHPFGTGRSSGIWNITNMGESIQYIRLMYICASTWTYSGTHGKSICYQSQYYYCKKTMGIT